MPKEDLLSKVKVLEQKVQELEDIEDIKKLHREYLFFISNLEFEKALACFSDSITVDIANYGVCQGKAAVAKLFKEVIYQNVLQSKDAHFTGQAVISAKGKRAEGHWMFYRLLHKPSSVGWVQGRYDCEYVKEGNSWKFSVMKMKRPWPEFMGSSD
jgi:hypothetical protein